MEHKKETNNTAVELDPSRVAYPLVQDINGHPWRYVPDGEGNWSVQDVGVKPVREKSSREFFDINGFLNYVKKYLRPESNVYITLNLKSLTFIVRCLFDDVNEWKEFQASFVPITSIEFDEWTRNKEDRMSQDEFALFLEKNLDHIVEDTEHKITPAQVLDSVLHMRETRNLTIGSSVNLVNGVTNFKYQEENGATGQFSVPAEIVIGIPIFENGDRYKVRVKIRYRIDRNAGSVVWWYEIPNLELVYKAACEGLASKIRDGLVNEEGEQLVDIFDGATCI